MNTCFAGPYEICDHVRSKQKRKEKVVSFIKEKGTFRRLLK